MEKIAVIDLGSNSVRMTISHLRPDGAYRMVEQVRVMVRLSEQMGEERLLRPEPILRTIRTLKMFGKLIAVHEAKTVYPVATAAVRQAANRDEFLEEVARETGFRFRVITGEEEARYDFLGVVNTMSLDACCYIDIGGASTEIGLVEDRRLKACASLPWGAVNLTERFGITGKSAAKRCREAEAHLAAEIAALPFARELAGLPVVGLGGTIRTLAKVDKKKRGFPLEGLHGYRLSADRVLEDCGVWMKMSLGEKREIPGIGRSRADIISGALTPLLALLKATRPETLVISGHGLREGVLFEHLTDRLGWKSDVLFDVRGHHVDNVMKLHHMPRAHGEHVRRIALTAFDSLQPLHGADAFFRDILANAALLHDIGMHIDYYNHHQHSFYLVMNAELNGFSHRERVLIALLCGMHRDGSELKADLKALEPVLENGDLETVRRVAPCLMLAERLDRSESGLVREVRMRMSEDAVRISVLSDADASLEIGAAGLVSTVFEKVFGRQLEIREYGRQT